MASFNKVLLLGNLTRDPELRYTPKGTAVADIGMAINKVYRTADGAEKEEVCYVTVETWGRQAETAGEYLSKGAPIFVEGELKLEQWTNKEGKKQSTLKVRAERIQFLGRPKNAEYREGGSGGSRPARSAPAENRPAAPVEDEPPAAEEDDIPF
ncbi:MAG: single-stranded DNA-binding protein [Verrucomicrobiae bacterium]|nr:single-stranded DNA-binding protein [Verrucomicrobiae bacterium]